MRKRSLSRFSARVLIRATIRGEMKEALGIVIGRGCPGRVGTVEKP